MPTFQEALEFGEEAEKVVSKFLVNKGYLVYRVYAHPEWKYKGPSIFIDCKRYTAPDILALRKGFQLWEVKRKTSFGYYRKGRHWGTGMNTRLYDDYLSIERLKQIPVYVAFLHDDPRGAKDTPEDMIGKAPTGLFVGRLSKMKPYQRDDRNRMVYWKPEDFPTHYPLEGFDPRPRRAHSFNDIRRQLARSPGHESCTGAVEHRAHQDCR